MPELAQQIPAWAVLEEAQIPGLDLLRELIEFCSARPNITTAKLLEHWRDRAAGKHLGQLVVQDLKLDESNAEQYWHEALRSICQEINRQQLEQISEAQRQGLMSEAEKDKLRRLLKTKQDLKNRSDEM